MSLVLLNVYRMNDSDLGFYHRGVVHKGLEYTYCQDIGVVTHEPRECIYSTYLGSVRLGRTKLKEAEFLNVIKGTDTLICPLELSQ